MKRRLKNWIVRSIRPLVAEAVRPALEQSAEQVLDATAARTLAGIEAAAAASMASVQASTAPVVRSLEEVEARHLADMAGQLVFTASHQSLIEQLKRERDQQKAGYLPRIDLAQRVRGIVRKHAGLRPETNGEEDQVDLLTELRFLWTNSTLVRPMMDLAIGKRVLYAGQCYYNLWYLSRALRERGWKSDLLNWDGNPSTQIYYHGEDFRFAGEPDEAMRTLRFYVEALYAYDVFHFANARGIAFGWSLQGLFAPIFGEHGEIHLLKALGKKVAYTNNGCLDGVSQSSFARWGEEPVCAICRWRNEPSVCSDQRNLEWGSFRNSVADYQCLLGGNRVDFNDDPRVHEDPWVYCLDPEVWRPDLEIPERFRVQRRTERTLLLYHAVGHKDDRTLDDGVNIKSSHVYLPLIDRLKTQGWDLELLEPSGVPNRDVRYLQLQADIFLEMLTYGWFGANAREAMMLGKPVICYIRPEWLESLREEVPEYAEELPIVSATPDTVEEVLLDLMRHPEKRAEIGRRSREFMLRWHSAPAAAAHFDEIYSRLLRGDPVLRAPRPQAAVRGLPVRRATR